MREIFYWEASDELTGNWHEDGGLLIIATDMEAAKETLENHGIRLSEADWTNATVLRMPRTYFVDFIG